MKKAYLLGVLVVAIAALNLTPTAARLVGTETDPVTDTAPVLLETFDFQVAATSIVCTFECADGTGFALDPCTDGSLGACCANGEPACSAHGGLESGICKQGRLGLPCTPL